MPAVGRSIAWGRYGFVEGFNRSVLAEVWRSVVRTVPHESENKW